MKVSAVIFSILVLLYPSFSFANSVEYILANLGGNTYRYDYKVTSDGALGASTPLKLLDIEFDPNLYSGPSLSITSPSSITSNWSEQILTSAPGVPALYDVFATGAGVLAGSNELHFSVQFNWLGQKRPGPQSFTLYNPDTFDVLQNGTTIPSYGDISGNGTVGIEDALLALHAVIGVKSLTAEQEERADVAPLGSDGKPHPNGTIDTSDVIIILQKAIGVKVF